MLNVAIDQVRYGVRIGHLVQQCGSHWDLHRNCFVRVLKRVQERTKGEKLETAWTVWRKLALKGRNGAAGVRSGFPVWFSGRCPLYVAFVAVRLFIFRLLHTGFSLWSHGL